MCFLPSLPKRIKEPWCSICKVVLPFSGRNEAMEWNTASVCPLIQEQGLSPHSLLANRTKAKGHSGGRREEQRSTDDGVLGGVNSVG